jgi:lipopolysaccharide export system protein LptA
MLMVLILLFFSISPSFAGDHIIRGTRLGCKDLKYYQKIWEYYGQGDSAAYNTAVNTGILRGQCIIFQDGESVFETDIFILSEAIKVRKKGGMAEF